MTNWHNNNPIMTTENAVTIDDLIAKFSLNGSDDVRRFDLRIASDGSIFSRHVPGLTHGDLKSTRDGTVEYSDQSRNFETPKGRLAEYFRNYFGVIVRHEASE